MVKVLGKMASSPPPLSETQPHTWMVSGHCYCWHDIGAMVVLTLPSSQNFFSDASKTRKEFDKIVYTRCFSWRDMASLLPFLDQAILQKPSPQCLCWWLYQLWETVLPSCNIMWHPLKRIICSLPT